MNRLLRLEPLSNHPKHHSNGMKFSSKHVRNSNSVFMRGRICMWIFWVTALTNTSYTSPISEGAVFSWNSLCWRSTKELCDYVTHSQSAWTLVFLISTFLMRKGASNALIFSRCQYSSPMLSFVFSKGCSLEPCTQTSSVTQCIFCNKAFALKIHFYDKQFKKLSELSTVDVISLLYDLYCQFN